jgi:DeoR family transcriptional regulator, fructose operon transcriptional repressor
VKIFIQFKGFSLRWSIHCCTITAAYKNLKNNVYILRNFNALVAYDELLGILAGSLAMFKIEGREQKLLEMLQNYRRLDIKSIADRFDISESTARRMFSRMEKNKKLIRIHGGVQLPEPYLKDYSYHIKESRYLHEKVAIGNYCASIIESGERIFCDSGTTIHQFILSLSNRIKAKEIQDIIVLSNSLSNFNPIANYCKVIILGGEVRLNRMDVCGSIAEEVLKKFHITKAFFGTDAVCTKKGFMTIDERTAKMNEIVLASAEASYALYDSSKIGRESFISYARPEQITESITDWNITESTMQYFKQFGFRIRKVAQPDKSVSY